MYKKTVNHMYKKTEPLNVRSKPLNGDFNVVQRF